jgi:hypothetical protein
MSIIPSEYEDSSDDQDSGIEEMLSERVSSPLSPETTALKQTQPTSQKYKSLILYMSLVEMQKDIYTENKQKGKVFIKLFKSYFEEQEKKWFKIVRDLVQTIKMVRTDRDFLLGKHVENSQEGNSLNNMKV